MMDKFSVINKKKVAKCEWNLHNEALYIIYILYIRQENNHFRSVVIFEGWMCGQFRNEHRHLTRSLLAHLTRWPIEEACPFFLY